MRRTMAILTGARDQRGARLKLENVTLKDLGRARRIVVDKDNTTVIDGPGQEGDRGRCNEIRPRSRRRTSDYDREKLGERLAKSSRARGRW